MEEPTLEASDFDIDFGVTESGRTMILGKYDDGTFDDMEFSITNSGRTTEMGNVTMSERTMDTVGTIGTIGDSTIGSVSSSILDSTRSVPENTQSAVGNTHSMLSNAATHRSAPRAIPKPTGTPNPPQQPSSLPSQPNSAGSSGSAFLSNILNPTASTFNNTQLSHTPPTHISTSYEASHFGKRARSGVSFKKFGFLLATLVESFLTRKRIFCRAFRSDFESRKSWKKRV